MRISYDQDADINHIKQKNIAIFGYGSQGHAHAHNLRDSGMKNVKIALPAQSRSVAKAQKAQFDVVTPEDAAAWADILMLLVPDEIQAELYKHSIEPHIKKGATLAFAHGFSIHFKLIEPRADCNVIMIAPKGPGHTVRAQYVAGGGVPCLMAVEQDPERQSSEIALAYAAAIGGGRAGIIETTFAEECETDLFGEQAVLCGGLTSLIKAGFETLTEAGYAPEMAYFECVHEVKLIVDLIYEGGIANMRYSISNTAEYGDYTSGEKIIDRRTKARMQKILADIQKGVFASRWVSENKAGQPEFKARRRREAQHPIESVGKKLREMMPWITKSRLVDKEKN